VDNIPLAQIESNAFSDKKLSCLIQGILRYRALDCPEPSWELRLLQPAL